MYSQYHILMTTRALADHFSQEALETVLQANVGQDSLLNLLKSQYHFDANAFEESFAYVRSQKAAVLDKLGRGALGPARAAFGRLTHAVQDFYAHTNYTALWLEAHPQAVPGTAAPPDPLDSEILHSDRLIAARIYYPLEALTIFRALVPALKARLPADSHANMNLDSPASGPLFPLALAAAEERTIIEFETLRNQIASDLGSTALESFLDRKLS